jgi:peroxiredoxin
LILIGVGLIIASIAVYILAAGDGQPASSLDGISPQPALVNYQAPQLELVDMTGSPVTLGSLRGQVVLVNNWATWCPPCRAEMPALESYYRAHQEDGFTLVAINSGDKRDQVEGFAAEYGLTFPLWLDPTGLALRAFRNNALPSSYVIDRSGTVRMFWSGALTQEALEHYLTPLLSD